MKRITEIVSTSSHPETVVEEFGEGWMLTRNRSDGKKMTLYCQGLPDNDPYILRQRVAEISEFLNKEPEIYQGHGSRGGDRDWDRYWSK